MAQRTTLQNAVFVLGGQLGARMLALVLYAVLARHLGTELYGDLGVGAAFGIIAALLLEPGLNALVLRDGAKDPAALAQRAGDSLGYKAALLVPVWLGIVAAGWLMGYRGSTLQAIGFFGGTQLLVVMEDLCSTILFASDRMDLEGTLRVTSKFVFSVAGLGGVALGLSFPALLGAMCAAQGLVAVFGLGLVFRTGLKLSLRPAPSRILGLLAIAWPLAVAGGLWQLTARLDQVIASQLGVPRGDLGDYNAAVKLVEALILFPNAIVTTFAPVLARTWPRGVEPTTRELRLVLESTLLVTTPIVLGGALLAHDIGTLVYGAAFAGAGAALAVQLFALFFVAIQFTTFSTLVAAGSLRSQAIVVALNLGANVVANALLVPRVGILGASLAANVGGLVAAVACVALLRRIGLKPGLVACAWRPALAGLGMAAVVWLVRARFGFYAALAAGAVTYAALLLALGGMRTLHALRERRGHAPA